METTNKLLTMAQAAELSACSTKTLRRAIDAGQLTAYRLGQGAKSDRIHPAELDAWWAKSRLAVAPPIRLPIASPSLETEDEQIARILARSAAKSKPPATRKTKRSRRT